MRALVFTQIPDSDIPPAVTADQFPLIWMDNDIIDRRSVAVTPLNRSIPRIPDLHRAVFGARHYPFPFAVEGQAGDVARVPFEFDQRVRIAGFDVEHLRFVVSCRGDILLVLRDSESVHLRVGEGDRAGTDA